MSGSPGSRASVHRPHREGPGPVETHPVRSEDAPLCPREALVSILRDKLTGMPDNIELSRAVVMDIIHHLDREPTATTSTGGTDDTRSLQFLTRYGDYAGGVWNDLKFRFSGTLRHEQATGAISLLREELGVQDSEPLYPRFSSGLEFDPGTTPVARNFQVAIKGLRPRMAPEIAVFAAEAYALRNLACHSATSLMVAQERCCDGKPSDEQTRWEAILDYFKARWIRQNSEGVWEVQEYAPKQREDRGKGPAVGKFVPTISPDDVEPSIYRSIPIDTTLNLIDSKRFVVDPQARFSNNYKWVARDESGSLRRSRASSDPSTDRLLKRQRSEDVVEDLPGKRLCIREEEAVGSNNQQTDIERSYTKTLHNVFVHLSTLSDKIGLGAATVVVNGLKSVMVAKLEEKAKAGKKASRKQGKREGRKMGMSGGVWGALGML
ncbi:hypothetical protein NPX13_g4458 [Xylaria arbuscula]|uniref:Uncharacterized protein n=1 Tax=Xylaria arbuscula TaxID=114810 RepID=A0A9W8NGB2_9PEZI|nr:hypothetical protein NPX13_g4458 [Xylaria arbuscula]